ncbi:MAG TPA: hypothetical protein VNZ58_11390 [Thermomicrobiales bacterium]|nr:hypothetical protein [Thermomicrobiales bacterium]
MRHSPLLSRSLMIVATVLAVLIAGMPVGQVLAQESTSYTSQLTGSVVQTAGSWTIDAGDASVENGMEFVTAQGSLEFLQIAWLPGNVDLVTARDLLVNEYASVFDSFVSVDRGAYGNVSYSLDITSSSGVEFGVFTLFLGQRSSGYVEAYAFFGPVMYFAEGISSAQKNVTIDGETVLQEIDGSGLQSFLAQNAGATGSSAPTPVPTGGAVSGGDVTPAEPTATSVPTAAVESGGSGEADAYLDSIRGEIDYLNTSMADFIINFSNLSGGDVDAAVQEINRISGEWMAYADRANAIVAPAGVEEIDAAYRTLAADVATMGNDWRLYVSSLQSGQGKDEALDVFLADIKSVQQEIADLSGMLDAAAGGGSVEAETPVPVDPTPTAVVSPTQETVVTGGGGSKGSLGGSKTGGNETETGGGAQTGTTTTQVGSGEYADLGLVADGTYVSPQTGVEITWDDTWFFDESYKEPISSDTESGLDSVTISSTENTTASIFLTVGTAGGVTPADMANLWASADYLAKNAAPGAEVLANETGRSGAVSVMIRDYLDNGTEIIILRSASCADAACDTLVLATMIGLPDTFGDAYQDARSGIEVEGNQLFSVLTPRDISAAIGN